MPFYIGENSYNFNSGQPADGITPTGTITITKNRLYEVSNFAQAVINVPTGPARDIDDVQINDNIVNIPAGLYHTNLSINLPLYSIESKNIDKIINTSTHKATLQGSAMYNKGWNTNETTTPIENLQVSISELATGTQIIQSASGTYDISNYQYATVAAPNYQWEF